MASDSIRRYAERPWAEIQESRLDYRARQLAQGGLEGVLRATHALWLHMRAVRPDWPTHDDRNADLAHHAELRRLLDQAARALAGR